MERLSNAVRLFGRTTGNISVPFTENPHKETIKRKDLDMWIEHQARSFGVQWQLNNNGANVVKNLKFFTIHGNHDGSIITNAADSQRINGDNGDPVHSNDSDHEDAEESSDQITKITKNTRKRKLTSHEVTYLCHRFRKETENKRRKAFGNIPCSCKAKIIVQCSEEYPLDAKITYFWQHNNHEPGSNENLASAPLSKQDRRILMDLVDSSLTWVNIKALLRHDEIDLVSILENGNGARLPTTLRITYSN
ncbi:hypothetical protein DM01DRAFT_1324366, partial [Hesseltinella vesiculosa]